MKLQIFPKKIKFRFWYVIWTYNGVIYLLDKDGILKVNEKWFEEVLLGAYMEISSKWK